MVGGVDVRPASGFISSFCLLFLTASLAGSAYASAAGSGVLAGFSCSASFLAVSELICSCFA
jgi:hypothetical protein